MTIEELHNMERARKDPAAPTTSLNLQRCVRCGRDITPGRRFWDFGDGAIYHAQDCGTYDPEQGHGLREI